MNRLKKSLFALAATAIGLFSLPSHANAFTVKYVPEFRDVEDFEALISNGGYREEFVVQSQIGNNTVSGQNPLSGDSELQIFDAVYSTNSTPYRRTLPGVASSQFAFTSGQAVDFKLQVTGSQVTYTVGNRVLSSSSFTSPFTDLFLRTRADSGSLLLSNLKLNNQSIGSGSLESNSSDTLKYLIIGGIQGDFTLTGQSTMNFTQAPFAQAARGARIAYQIKAGRLTDSARQSLIGETEKSVPEPGTVGALLLAGIAFVGSSRRQKVAE